MRDDMFKVIVERPRLVNSNAYRRDGRRYRNAEDAPGRLGMKEGYGHTKWLNENLRPLERYLESQVNRPWDKVYGDIRATIDARSTVKQHVLQHLNDLVVINARWEETAKGGRVLVPMYRWSGAKYVPSKDSSRLLYVHPISKILLRNKGCKSYVARARDEKKAQQMALMCERRVISEYVQLHCIEGIWYEVELKVLRRFDSKGLYDPRLDMFVLTDGWDVVLKFAVTDNARAPSKKDQDARLKQKYGDARLYAAAKRQLSLKELKKHGLTNKAPSGLIFLPRVLHRNTASPMIRYPFPVSSHFQNRDPHCAQLTTITLGTPCHAAATICRPCYRYSFAQSC